MSGGGGAGEQGGGAVLEGGLRVSDAVRVDEELDLCSEILLISKHRSYSGTAHRLNYVARAPSQENYSSLNVHHNGAKAKFRAVSRREYQEFNQLHFVFSDQRTMNSKLISTPMMVSLLLPAKCF